MTDENKTNESNFASFLKEIREYARTAGEGCPEGHRLDPATDRCLPINSTDYTAFTRSINDDQGPEWRGEKDKTNVTFASQQESALDADNMDEPESCAEGTTFSFIQRRCVSIEEAELENADENAVDEEEAAAPGSGGHQEITMMQPEGRRDPLNHDCPSGQFFDYARRECIPLNKDTVMASEDFDSEFKKAVATYGNVAITSPDPIDGHKHITTLDMDGNGVTSMTNMYMGGSHPHSHDVKKFVVSERSTEDYTSRHPGVAVPEEHIIQTPDEHYAEMDKHSVTTTHCSDESAEDELGVKITTNQRNALNDSSFGVPAKRKFPLDSCARVRNAMARFNQAKGLTSDEKATLRRKILSRAKSCDIEITKFAKADTVADFEALMHDLLLSSKDRLESYKVEKSAGHQGPCPPGMVWDAVKKKCGKVRGFVDSIREDAQHVDIVNHQPEGRRDTVGFQCPDGSFFDFTNRRCLPLDPSQKPGSTTDKANSEEGQRDLAPAPKGRPARLPQDCPAGTIWNADRNDCVPLDSSKKTKSEALEAQTTAVGPGKGKDSKGCAPGEFFNPFIKKCMPKKGSFKGKSEELEVQSAAADPGKDSNGCAPGEFFHPFIKKCFPKKKSKSAVEDAADREGLVPAPEGKVKLPVDCPPGTFYNTVRKVCVSLDSMDKNRPSGASPQPAKDSAEVDDLSISQIIQQLDEILKSQAASKEKSKVLAKDLPNAAFPPSLVGSTKRSLMHHIPSVEDPYDNDSVDVGRLRNAIARSVKVEGFSEKAVQDAQEHLLYHARAIIAKKD